MAGGKERQRHAHPANTARSTSPTVIENRPDRRKKGRPRIRTGQEASPNVRFRQLSNTHRIADQELKRRRTQIRLAQRAYRSRKEATIVSLEGRVHQLEMLVEQINKTFLSFTDELMKYDVLILYPDLARKLHQTIEQSLSFTNQAVPVVHDDSGTSTDAERLEANAKPDILDKAASKSTAGAKNTHYLTNIEFPDVLQSSQWVQRGRESQNPTQVSPKELNILVPEIPTEAPLFPQTPLVLNAPSASVYEPIETSFAHRLYHACVQRGYDCLRDPSSRLEKLAYIFRFPLKILTPQHIIAHFETYLRHGYYGGFRGINIPFFSIGGAGTHFTHNQRSYLIEDTTPQPSIIHVATNQIDRDMLGDWFDCYDVEEYLRKSKIVPSRGLSLETRLPPPAYVSASDLGLHDQYQSGSGIFQQSEDQKFIDETILIQCGFASQAD